MSNINDTESCFAWFPSNPQPGAERGTMKKASKWTAGDQITVAFLGGAPELQEKVKQVAREWVEPGMANLRLIFVQDPAHALIRVSFVPNNRSWSVIGRYCRDIKAPEPTMNFGWLTSSSSPIEIRRVVLHEFGHALGLEHEHQNPAGGIRWNKEQVYKDLLPTWSKRTIDLNLFEPLDRGEERLYTAFDPRSIMVYPIPARWTLDGYSVPLNSDFSDVDRYFIREQYP
jgi:serralysin